jgi:hypothetical protein
MHVKNKGILILYIHGSILHVYEHSSRGVIEKLIELAEREYGVSFTEKLRSRCG